VKLCFGVLNHELMVSGLILPPSPSKISVKLLSQIYVPLHGEETAADERYTGLYFERKLRAGVLGEPLGRQDDRNPLDLAVSIDDRAEVLISPFSALGMRAKLVGLLRPEVARLDGTLIITDLRSDVAVDIMSSALGEGPWRQRVRSLKPRAQGGRKVEIHSLLRDEAAERAILILSQRCAEVMANEVRPSAGFMSRDS
jgi:hypothetical protein